MFVKQFVTDLATLRLPVTAAAVVATGLAVIKPFGVDLVAAQLTGALVGVGALAEFIKRYVR